MYSYTTSRNSGNAVTVHVWSGKTWVNAILVERTHPITEEYAIEAAKKHLNKKEMKE